MIGNTAPRRWRLAVDVLAVLTAAALLISSWALYARFNETNRARQHNAAIWHAVICDIEQQIIVNDKIHEHPMSKAKLRWTLRFYDRLLIVDAHAAPCGLVTGR